MFTAAILDEGIPSDVMMLGKSFINVIKLCSTIYAHIFQQPYMLIRAHVLIHVCFDCLVKVAIMF